MAYATATGADAARLLNDRPYKEQHRAAIGSFFQKQLEQRPRLLEEQFVDVVKDNLDVDVLFITGMRDKAPVASLSHLVPDTKLADIHVRASEATKQARKGVNDNETLQDHEVSSVTELDYSPALVFDNDMTGSEAVEQFASQFLPPFLDNRLQKLADMVRVVPNFPSRGINFRHVLSLLQQPSGLAHCVSLLRDHFIQKTPVNVIVSCEAGGFVFASPLALITDTPVVLVRNAGKLPPPTYSVSKVASHISESLQSTESKIELERNAIPKGASVVVVDDVFASGRTICAMLRLLEKAHVCIQDVSVLVVAEFPLHAGRKLLHRCGFGAVSVQSLLVFDGA